MMKPTDHHDHDDDITDVQSVAVTVKNPKNDPPGNYYFRPPLLSGDDDAHQDDDNSSDDDDDGLASLSTMDTSTFRRLRDRRRQHTTNSHHHHHRGAVVGSRRKDAAAAAERGFGNNFHRIEKNGNDDDDGSSRGSLFSSSSSTTRMMMRGVLGGWHHDYHANNNNNNDDDRRVVGRRRQQRWTTLVSSSTQATTTTTAKSTASAVLPSSSRKNGVCGSNNRFIAANNGRRDYLSWQHVVLYLGMMGFSLVMWTTGSEILTTILRNEEESTDDLHYREIGMGMMKHLESEKFDGEMISNGERDFIGNYTTTEAADLNDGNAVSKDSAENSLQVGNEMFRGTAGDATMMTQEKVVEGVEKNDIANNDVQGQKEAEKQPQLSLQHVVQEGGDQQSQQPGQLEQIQSQQQPSQLEQIIQAPSPPSVASVSASLSTGNKTLEHKSALLISSNQQQIIQGGLGGKVNVEGGGVIVANSNNTSIYSDGIADDNPRLWGVKE